MQILILVLVVLGLTLTAAVCSGLNIALMSIDPGVLRRKAALGDMRAIKVLPLRRNTHLTLSAILLTNVAAVSATSLVLESMFYGVIAGLATTLIMVIFGEILPQAYFSRQALNYCARLWIVMKLMILLTYPVAKPLQLLLDRILKPNAARHLQSRHELGLMIAEHLGQPESELDDGEIDIIRGALQLSEKHVSEIMTPIRLTYWLTPETELTDRKINEIKAAGRSRIPIFNRERTKSYGVLLMKDLVDIDFGRQNLRVDNMHIYPANTVGSMTALDTMFHKFIASGTHLVPIERDDKIVGIVTIEDLIEEIVGHEIRDEIDRRKRRK